MRCQSVVDYERLRMAAGEAEEAKRDIRAASGD